jgi:hypothetical protein
MYNMQTAEREGEKSTGKDGGSGVYISYSFRFSAHRGVAVLSVYGEVQKVCLHPTIPVPI